MEIVFTQSPIFSTRNLHTILWKELISMNNKLVKVVGVVCTVIGFGLQIVQSKLEDNKLAEKVAEEVAKQLNK